MRSRRPSNISNERRETVKQEMANRGFQVVPEEDLQFEYESDTIEKYEMLSNEFDFDELRKNDQFGVK